MMDPRAQQAVSQISDDVQTLFGADLVSLVLYGSAAGSDFVPGRSDLNLAIVLKKVQFEHLRQLQGSIAAWHALGAALPLLLDRESLASACDVFPMEFQDIKDSHQRICGEDLFSALDIDWKHLRYQAEHEVRGKLLRLRSLYVEVGDDRERLQRLLIDSVKTFVIVMRSLLRLRAGKRHVAASYLDVVAAFEQQSAVSFPMMRVLLLVKSERQAWPVGFDDMLRAYLAEVERLVALVDQLEAE